MTCRTRETLITCTMHGPWVKPGKKSRIHCGVKNFLRGGSVQTKK
ncbi:hypothetical protein [Streptomyces sp. NPDC054786]